MKKIFVRMNIQPAEDHFTMEVPKDASKKEVYMEAEKHFEEFVRNSRSENFYCTEVF